jgi:hydroxyacylglutathione hydrolase
MFVAQYYLDCLSQASYLLADESTGRAVVVDARRVVAAYLPDARARGLRIEGVINTHFHTDFVAGHLELAAATGAWIGYGWRAQTEYRTRALAAGDRVSLGELTLEILETPGHTPESVSVLVYERADDAVPYAVLTGDTLLVGDVGRPDPVASLGDRPELLARLLYHSVQHTLMALPDEVRVLPGHGLGALYGSNLSAARSSTIGEQRRTSCGCWPMSEREFVSLVTAEHPVLPGYVAYNAILNRVERPLLDPQAPPVPLSAAEFLDHRTNGAAVIDTRPSRDFAAAHVRRSVNVPVDGRFADAAGSVFRPGQRLLVVAPQDRQAEVVTRLARIGLDSVVGYLREPAAALPTMGAELAAASRITVSQLREALTSRRAPVVLDVRNPAEWAREHVEGSVNVPFAQLPQRIAELPADRPVAVHCAGGYRSSVAASLLRKEGCSEVSDLIGGYTAWQLQPQRS